MKGRRNKRSAGNGAAAPSFHIGRRKGAESDHDL
jgi:hypothetical protein